VRRRGRGPGLRAAGLDHQDRRVLGDLAGGLDELPAVLDALQVGQDHVSPRIVAPLGDEVAFVQHRLVAQGDDVFEPHVAVVGPVQHCRDERAGLTHERDRTGLGVLRAERRVHPDLGTHDSQTVGSDDVEVVLVGDLSEAALATRPVTPGLAESGRDDDHVLDAGLATTLDHVHGDGCRHHDHCHVDGPRHRADVLVALETEDGVGVGIDGDHLTVEVGGEVRRDGAAD
jgi:hypothetical protein